MTYKYSIRCEDSDYTIWEREPSRYLDIQPSSGYKGQLGERGSSAWPNCDKVFIVNGHIEKQDANFVGGLYFNEIGDENIFIGPYPQIKEDADTLASRGVTAVFNVQTENDFKHRGINWDKMVSYYKAKGITPVHYPIHDFNAQDLSSKLVKGAAKLNDLIND